MRVLVDYRPALRERTGVGEYVHELAKALARQSEHDRNDRITLFTSSWKDRPAAALASEMPASVRIADVRVPVRGLIWSWNRLQWPPVEWLAGPQDVVHSQSPMLIPARAAAQVITIHDLDFLNNPGQMSAEIRRDYPRLARAHAARADAIVVPSHHVAGEVTRQLQVDKSRIHVCSPGHAAWIADVRRRRASSGRAGRHFLFVGTLSERKNPGTLLRAYARVRETAADAPPLIIAGHRPPAFEKYAPMLDQPPLKGHVTVTGYVDAQRRVELYEHAAVLVLPSYEEGFGFPVLEAMACGVPVVISNRGSLPEVAGPAATPLDPDDVEGFARQMQALLDPDIAEAAAARGLQQSATYDWDACAAATRHAYRAAIEAHARRH